MEGGKGNTSVPAKNNNPYTKPFNAKCSNECPKWKTMNVVEKDDDVTEDEACGLDRDDDYKDYEQEEYNFIVRKLILSPKYGDETQHHKLFRTRCTVQGSLCDLIIDDGSQKNIISKDIMEMLQLATETHPNPYTIG